MLMSVKNRLPCPHDSQAVSEQLVVLNLIVHVGASRLKALSADALQQAGDTNIRVRPQVLSNTIV
jgi:hypothetical protein